MDDPLHTEKSSRYTLDAEYAKFGQRLRFEAAPSLRYFDSSSDEDRDRGSSSVDIVDEVLRSASKLPGHVEPDRENATRTTVDSDNAAELQEPSESTPSGGLKLIIGSGDGKRQALSLRSQDFTQILDVCKFPKTFPQSILTNNGSFARFTEYEVANGKHLPSALSVIFRTPYSPVWDFSCVIRVKISDRSAICLFFGKDKSKIGDLWKRLQTSRDSLHANPLSLISLLFKEHSYSCEKYRDDLDGDVVNMERKTGHTSISVSLFKQNPDYEQLTRDLNACKTSLIFMDNITLFEKQIGEFCKETLEVLELLRSERGLDTMPTGERVAAAQQLDYHLNLSQLRRTQASSLERRIQTQINVLYSLISQRDTNVSIIIAEDSKKIALAAKRDSTAMKTISVLTMVFLPGTFVASVFSAGIFSFDGAADGSTVGVSKGWWVYFVVTTCLTLVTVAIWVCYIKWRRNENIRELEKLE